MRIQIVVVALLSVALLTGCFRAATPQRRYAQYDEAEYEPFLRLGSGKIVGQAFMRQRGGGVVKAAGSVVFLNPVTAYSTEWFTATMMGMPLEPPDPSATRATECTKETRADADGKFHFDDLAAGDYYVITFVSWEVPLRYGTSHQGGSVGAEVHVENNKTTEAILTR